MFTGSNCKQKTTNPSTTDSNTNVTTTTYFITTTTTALPNNYTNTARFIKINFETFYLK